MGLPEPWEGSLDRLLYDRELLTQRWPFDELKRQSRINEIVNRAPQDGFGEFLRTQLPGYHAADMPALAEVGSL